MLGARRNKQASTQQAPGGQTVVPATLEAQSEAHSSNKPSCELRSVNFVGKEATWVGWQCQTEAGSRVPQSRARAHWPVTAVTGGVTASSRGGLGPHKGCGAACWHP